jgi:large subunit ribosomal protein L27
MAHKTGQGSSRNGRDSLPKFRGLKAGNGQMVHAGTIIVRQCGTKFKLGTNVGLGRDYTIYAMKPGKVEVKGRYISVLVAATTTN